MTATVKLDAILTLAPLVIGLVGNVVDMIRAKRLKVVDDQGVELHAEEVGRRCDLAIADAIAAGDKAADRIEGRNGG